MAEITSRNWYEQYRQAVRTVSMSDRVMTAATFILCGWALLISARSVKEVAGGPTWSSRSTSAIGITAVVVGVGLVLVAINGPH